jgi:hypothetical protein
MHEAGKVLSLHDAAVEQYLQCEPESGRVPVQRGRLDQAARIANRHQQVKP